MYLASHEKCVPCVSWCEYTMNRISYFEKLTNYIEKYSDKIFKSSQEFFMEITQTASCQQTAYFFCQKITTFAAPIQRHNASELQHNIKVNFAPRTKWIPFVLLATHQHIHLHELIFYKSNYWSSFKGELLELRHACVSHTAYAFLSYYYIHRMR